MTLQMRSSEHYKNDLRRLTRVIGAALAAFGVLLIVVVAYAGWSANRSAVSRERQLVENALDESVSRVLDEQKSVAWWDDAVVNLGGPRINFEWADIQFGAFLNETYGHDEIYVLNEHDEPVYAYVNGERVAPSAFEAHRAVLNAVVREVRTGQASAMHARARRFSAGQGNYRELLGAANARWSGHILRIEGQPAVVSAITIGPNVDASLLKGTPRLLVSVVRIDADFMRGLGSGLLMNDLAIHDTDVRLGNSVSERFPADDGAVAGYLSWTPKRPGQTLLYLVLPLMMAAVAGASAFAANMLQRLKRASLTLADREEQATYEAQHDALSGLANRAHFAEQLGARLEAKQAPNVVVAYIDIDRFKDINDTLGHHAGDELIKAVSARLAVTMGPHDFLARFGGDEFAVMRAMGGPDAGDALAERLRSAFAEPFMLLGQSIRLTCSIGLSFAPDHGRTTDALMRAADIALYEAKKQGRDRAMAFSADMAWDVQRRRDIELALREAFETDQLRLHYQPIVSAATGHITAVEALLRWRHPTQGEISPALFVPIAEEAGLMPALGAWVLERAMRDSLKWPELEVAINLSPVQFRHVDLEAQLTDIIKRVNVDPSRIVLEITEGVLLESSDRTRRMLNAIRGMGFKTALDDFGTGYSSLSYLCDFRFDKIKIDRAFVHGVTAAKQAMTVVQAVVTIGRGLGMTIVAEGVETETEASFLRLAGCHEIQGFYFSMPVPPEDIAPLVTEFAAGAGRAANITATTRRRMLRSIGDDA